MTFARTIQQAEAGSFTSTYPEIFLAGAISGVFQTFIATPIDLIKIKLQAARKSDINYYVGPFDAVRGIYKTAGFKGFFQGFWTMLYRYSQHNSYLNNKGRIRISNNFSLILSEFIKRNPWLCSMDNIL